MPTLLSDNPLSFDSSTVNHLPDDPACSCCTRGVPKSLPETNGRYHLFRERAHGAMGVVYEGHDVSLDREVAVKLLHAAHLDNPEYRRRFAEEARITAKLFHPGVVPIYDIGVFPVDRPFYAMRLVSGRTLSEVLQARKSVGDYQSYFLKMFEKVCDAVAYAHSRGVIHRDLKPSNVMVAGFGVVKVMDWGLAKVLPGSPLSHTPTAPTPSADPFGEKLIPDGESEEHTLVGRILGTPKYMSPEQARGDVDRVDERTDVFSLGGILCEILTGSSPYVASDTQHVFQKALDADLSDAFQRLNTCGAEIELVTLCARCLAADPANRPRTAVVLAQELAECLSYKLQRMERDLVRFFDLSLDLFCIASTNGHFVRVNSNFSRVLGYTTETLLSQPFIDFVHPDDRERTEQEVTRLSVGMPCVHFLNRYRDIRGDYRWFEWSAKSIPEEGVIFAVARDVTERTQLQEKIRDQEKH